MVNFAKRVTLLKIGMHLIECNLGDISRVTMSGKFAKIATMISFSVFLEFGDFDESFSILPDLLESLAHSLPAIAQ